MARATTCPRCGSYVSQFAAGCSVCGADLDRLRHRPRVRLSRSVSAPELSEGALLTLLMVAVAWFAPLFGMALAALVFFDRYRRGHTAMRNVAAAAFVLAVIGFLIA
jgi:hypothetical protein